MQYVNPSINSVGSNTPGAASSAADLGAQEAPKSRPKPEKIDVEKPLVFRLDFIMVSGWFRRGFWEVFRAENGGESEKAKIRKTSRNTALAHRISMSASKKTRKFDPEIDTNRMFFWTSILEAFWEDFGRVLGARNPRFSHFFQCFFEANFEARFGRAQNRPKWPHGRKLRFFGAAIRSS